MYAVTARSSSAYQLARVSNEVKPEARKFAAPQSTPSIYNLQSSVVGASSVQTTTPSASNYTHADKANQITPVDEINTNNQTNQQKFSQPQQRKINRFNLEMIKETPKNINSRAHIEFVKQGGNASYANKFMETPYLIAMVNQSLSNMKHTKEDDNTANIEPEAEENTEGTKQRTSKLI